MDKLMSDSEMIEKLKKEYDNIENIIFNVIIFENSGIGVGLFVDGRFFEDEDLINSNNIFEVQEEIKEIAQELKHNFTNVKINYQTSLFGGNDDWY